MGKSPSHKKSSGAKPKWAMEQERFARRIKYPHCKGLFPDCPQEPSENECRLCPWYKK